MFNQEKKSNVFRKGARNVTAVLCENNDIQLIVVQI